MKWLLVNKFDEIVDTWEIQVVLVYQVPRPILWVLMQIDEENFDKLWKVMSSERYDSLFKATLQNRQYKWWEEEATKPDEGFDY